MGPESLAGWVTCGSCDHGPLAGRKNLILNWTLTWICKGIRKFGSESFTKGGDGTSPGGILRLGLCLPAKEGVTGSGSDVEAGERIAISQKAFALCLLGSVTSSVRMTLLPLLAQALPALSFLLQMQREPTHLAIEILSREPHNRWNLAFRGTQRYILISPLWVFAALIMTCRQLGESSFL